MVGYAYNSVACYQPLRVYIGKPRKDGKYNIVWKKANSWRGEKTNLPCGKCIGCTLDRSRQWAIRCMHEASLHQDNCFLTLTYNDANLPKDGSLQIDHWQKFMKRLREKNGTPTRYFHCGEYGPSLSRPHYHAILFGYDFNDKKLWKEVNNAKWYVSKELEELWPKGYHIIGDVTQASASYVARYCVKKAGIPKEDRKGYYGNLRPEYATMSRRPGIGKGWYDKFKTDVYPHDVVISGGHEVKVPRFYDNLLDKEDRQLLDKMKAGRKEKARKYEMDNDSFRLPVKEKVKRAEIKNLKRNLEDRI